MAKSQNLKVLSLKAIKVLRETPANPPQHVLSKKAKKVVRGHSRKHKVPPRVDQLIEWLNLLPPDLPLVVNLMNNALEDPYKALLVIDKLPPRIREFVLPPKPRKYLEQHPLRKDGRLDFYAGWQWLFASERYEYLVEGKKLLVHIADLMSRSYSDLEYEPLYKQEIESMRPILKFSAPSANWIPDKNGKLRPEPTLLVECLDEIDDIRRIRRCPICQKIYWAYRIDQPTCSKRCNNIRRSRIQRGTYEKSQAS